MSMTPGDQDVGWRSRWTDIERSLEQLLLPRTRVCSAESIAAAAQDLMWFYGIVYHLKDLLKIEPSIPGQTVEDAISNTPALALVCDLANLTKHGRLEKKPRSGLAPVILKREGTSSAGGWQLVLTIQHGADILDGLDVARDAVDAWRALLREWSLI
jgi:hypothetical protein